MPLSAADVILFGASALFVVTRVLSARREARDGSAGADGSGGTDAARGRERLEESRREQQSARPARGTAATTHPAAARSPQRRGGSPGRPPRSPSRLPATPPRVVRGVHGAAGDGDGAVGPPPLHLGATLSPGRTARSRRERSESVGSWSSATGWGEHSAAEGELVEPQLPIYKIVLTGGPCAGKTTAMARLSSFLRARNFRVYTVPEAATLLFGNGATFLDLETDEKQIRFQSNLMLTQFHLEDTFERLAQDCGSQAVLLCDRGAMDGSAYITSEAWSQLLDQMGLDEVRIRDQRYNAVVHMTTAAEGATEYYGSETNSVRLESAEQARELDKKVMRAWTGHPRMVVVDNSAKDFETKLRNVIDGVAQVVGLPSSQRASRKFLLRAVPAIPSSVQHVVFSVDKVYVKVNKRQPEFAKRLSEFPMHAAAAAAAPAEADEHSTPAPPPMTRSTSLRSSEDPGIYPYAFVRRRRQTDGLASYGITHVNLGPDGKKVETKRLLTAREYALYVTQQADPTRRVVKQKRTSFLWRNRFFEIYEYGKPHEGLCVLYCQIAPGDGEVADLELPPWLGVVRECTGEAEFSAYTLSLRPGSSS